MAVYNYSVRDRAGKVVKGHWRATAARVVPREAEPDGLHSLNLKGRTHSAAWEASVRDQGSRPKT